MQNQTAKFLTTVMVASGLAVALVASCASNSSPRPMGTGGSTGAGGSGPGGGGGDCTVTACPPPGVLDCSNAVKPTNTTINDYSTCYWRNTVGHFGLCPVTGSQYSYAGPAPQDGEAPSASTISPDLTAQNLHWTATVQPAGYAGYGLQFDACTDVSTFSGVQFAVSGSTGGCNLELQFATFDQRPTSQSPLPGGCDSSAGSCYGYPAATKLPLPADASTQTVVMVKFADVTSWSAANAAEIVGLQWQLTVPAPDVDAGQITCMSDLRIDDIAFIP